jgi:hypothetical protein
MWVKAQNGEAYNLTHATRIHLISGTQHNTWSIVAEMSGPENSRVILIDNLRLERAEEQYNELLIRMEAVRLPLQSEQRMRY